MNSSDVRQSFLDFFASRGHQVVPSASLLPTAPNLLFTNAGMNPFVPYFLGERSPAQRRVADTQKCIRAGGKHNDLDDVGYDAYHHTFFEMLGNWSFGDYFKEEALNWSWELLTDVWKMPAERLYATVYRPGTGDPAELDSEALAIWEKIFRQAGLDPARHILYGGKKDNFWMMGETGPCGPCSEIHIDLTPENRGTLVNADSPWCIELWNNVFIQFNATPEGDFVPLKERHVDTGMGFERIAGIFASTCNFTDFSRPPSNYASDLFGDLFAHLESLCGHRYGGTLPANRAAASEAEMRDVVYRVLADHARTLSCAIADGILPGNEGRNYVLRRILRRAVMYGRRLNLESGFFASLVGPVVSKLGSTFPELLENQAMIRKVISAEESAFDRTLDRGMSEFEKIAADLPSGSQIPGASAFTLYDTYGFPLDLTGVLASERGLSVDEAGFAQEMEGQRARARAARKQEIVTVNAGDAGSATVFAGYERENLKDFSSTLESLNLTESSGKLHAIFRETPFYAEMGGQVGDSGWAQIGDRRFEVVRTTKDVAGHFLHELAPMAVAGEGNSSASVPPLCSEELANFPAGSPVILCVDAGRRKAIERHHSATHVLNWALREVLGSHVRQAGSYVGPDRLRFDFAHFEQVSPAQLARIERLCNERILDNGTTRTMEIPYDEKPEDVVAVFGEKYGDRVRVVDIGGFSKELCGGTHVQAAGEIGLVKILLESSVSAGTRRIEAVAGEEAALTAAEHYSLLQRLAQRLSCKPAELEERFAQILEKQKDLEKQLKARAKAGSANLAEALISSARKAGDLQFVAAKVELPDADALRTTGVQILRALGEGLVVLTAVFGDKASLCALASEAAIAQGLRAGDIVRQLTAKLGGRGGGKPDFAMGGIQDFEHIEAVLEEFLQTTTRA